MRNDHPPQKSEDFEIFAEYIDITFFLWDSAPPQKIYCSKYFAELSLSHSPDLDRYLEMKLSQDIIAVQCIREIGECYDICIPNTARECIREIVLSQDRNISQATFARVLSHAITA